METLVQLCPSPLPVGTQFGVYQLEKVISADWFGPLYLAWNHHLGAHAVIEEYLPRPLGRRAEDGLNVLPKSAQQEVDFRYGLDRFLEESEMLIEIEHPNVIRIDSALPANGTLYRVMEYIDGQDFASVCGRQGTIIEARNLYTVALQLLEALMPVHEKGYAHGAMHPASIVRRANGDAVLSGFAWSQLALAARMQTLPQVLRDGYAAPEQYGSVRPPDGSADLYALGATLYRCVTGRDPAPTQQRIAARQRGSSDPQPKTTSDRSLTAFAPALLHSIDSMLSLDSSERPASTAALHAALKQEASAVSAADLPPTNSANQPDVKQASTRHTSHSARWALAGAAMVTGLAIATLLLRSPDNTQLVLGTHDQPMQQGVPKVLSPGKVAQQKPPAAAQSHQQSSGEESRPTAAAADDTRIVRPTGTTGPARPNAATPQPKSADIAHSPAPLVSLQDSAAIAPPAPSRAQQSSLRATKAPSVPTDAHEVPPAVPPEHPANAVLATNASRDDAIERHLAAAQQHLSALQLTTPPGNNAYEHFQAVLTLAPHHPKAQDGIDTILARYNWLIRKALAEGRLRHARVYLQRAEQITPATPVLEELRRALGEAEAYSPHEPPR